MKKIFIILSIFFFSTVFPEVVSTADLDSLRDQSSQTTPFPITCYCTYQVTQVNEDSPYFDPEANETVFLQTVFQTNIMMGSAFSTPSIGDQIAKCRVEAQKKGLGNATCTNEKVVKMTELKDDFEFSAPELQIKIPGFTGFSSPPTTWNKEEGVAYFTWFGEYIKAIYNFGLVAISILAVLMIIIQGIKIIASGIGGERKEAYKRITQAAIGLVLAWGSYTLLYMINPTLLEFRGLSIKIVTPIDIKDLIDNDSDSGEGVPIETAAGESCIPTQELYSIEKLVALGNVSYPYLHREAYEGLLKAIDEAKKRNVELLITSAYRDIKTQKAIWEQKLAQTRSSNPRLSEEEVIKQTRKYAAPPSCKSPHLTGKAIDLCIKGSSTCTKLKVEYAKTQNMTAEEKADVEKLKEIMKAAGWKNYTAEWWHYEYNCTECPTVNRQ